MWKIIMECSVCKSGRINPGSVLVDKDLCGIVVELVCQECGKVTVFTVALHEGLIFIQEGDR